MLLPFEPSTWVLTFKHLLNLDVKSPEQCDRMAKLFEQYWVIYDTKYLPDSIKSWQT